MKTVNPSQIDTAVLATIIKNPEAPEIFKEHLIPDAVGKINHSFGIYQIYTNMIRCYTEVGSIDLDSFKLWVQDYPELYEDMGGEEAYEEFETLLVETEPVEPNALYRLANNSYKKALIRQNVDEIKVKLGDDQASFEEIEELSEKLTHRVSGARGRQEIEIRTADDIANSVDSLWDEVPFLPTQFKGVNEALSYDPENGGMMRGGIYSIVATSGLGKSTLAKSMTNHWLDTGHKVLFINFEEAQGHWERILMTQITHENVYKAYKKTAQELSKLSEIFKAKLREWGSRLMVRHDPDSLYFEDLEHWLRDIYDNQEEDRPDVVVIDTIQSLFTKSGGGARWGDFEHIMVRLEKLAKDMDAVFLLTAQQNSNALRENRTDINQSDIGGGVTIPQKSTAALFLMPRKTDFDIDSYGIEVVTPIMEVHIPKNRIVGNGATRNPPLIQYDDELKLYLDYDLSQDRQHSTAALEDFGSISPTQGLI